MVAGEPSGDQLAAHLISALKARRPELSFSGIGGPRMIAQGFDSHVPMEKLAVRGYAEVLRHYREIMAIRRRLAERFAVGRRGCRLSYFLPGAHGPPTPPFQSIINSSRAGCADTVWEALSAS